MTTVTFNHTGAEQTWTVPTGVHKVLAKLWGAGGKDGSVTSAVGGTGGYVEGYLPVTPGETLYIYVGGDGLSGGFNSGTSNAGGASDIRQGGNEANTTTDNRTAIAGGGGAAGQAFSSDVNKEGDGGDGGSNTAESGESVGAGPSFAGGGGGGSQTDGGDGGQDDTGTSGQDGVLHSGGSSFSAGGDGGGGYYGGGEGAHDGHLTGDTNYDIAGGGGGGSNYVGGFEEIILNQRGQGNKGHGQIELWYPHISYYDGSSFVDKPLQFWTGSEWDTPIIKHYDSGNWHILHES